MHSYIYAAVIIVNASVPSVFFLHPSLHGQHVNIVTIRSPLQIVGLGVMQKLAMTE